MFVDSSAYFALVDHREPSHQRAGSVSARLIGGRRHLFTSNFVVAETHALVVGRPGRDIAFRVLAEIDASRTTVARVSAVDELRARHILARYTDKTFSLTDATSFAIMERLRIGQVFTLDEHFIQYGFATYDPI